MSALLDLVGVVARLRAPDGCPWDRAQDLQTLRPYLLEEVYEVLDALDGADRSPTGPQVLREELGDLLFVVTLLAAVAQERGWFSLEDAAAAISEKMVVRHPHVFDRETQTGASGAASGPGAAGGSGTLAAWEARKATEPDGRPRSRLAGVPRTLPGLLRSHRQGEKAAAVGFDWPDHQGALAKVHEELAELEQALGAHPPAPAPDRAATGQPAAHPAVEHELGDVLMALASLGRHVGAPPEDALRRANDRFQARFQEVERRAWQGGRALSELDAATLEALWEQAKADEGRR